MKLSIKKILIFPVIALILVQFSCEDKDSGVDLIGLEARFFTEIEGRTVKFNNISNQATNYYWDFGNGNTDSIANPIQTYENGTYNITLTAFNDTESSTFEDTIEIDVPVCEPETAENINPADGDINWTFLTNDEDTTFDAFGNTGGEIVTNPVIDNVNSSCNVQIFVKAEGCETFAGLGTGLSSPLDFSDAEVNKVFKMKVLAENQLTEVTLRLEFEPFPNTEPSLERVADITQIGEWQELTFDFSDVNTGTYSSMIIYFDRNQPCDGDIYYFDDLVQQ